MSARDEILRRIERVAPARPADEVAKAYAEIERSYLRQHHSEGILELFAERVADYRATVRRVTAEELPGMIAEALETKAQEAEAQEVEALETKTQEAKTLETEAQETKAQEAKTPGGGPPPAQGGDPSSIVNPRTGAGEPETGSVDNQAQSLTSRPGTYGIPGDFPNEWIARVDRKRLIRDPATTELDELAGAVTACAVGIAETGTIVLDHGPTQGPRALSLVPDYHLIIITADQVAADVPEALERLTPGRPLTFVSGPSATSDIELSRVEGVHGPRTLDVLLVIRD